MSRLRIVDDPQRREQSFAPGQIERLPEWTEKARANQVAMCRSQGHAICVWQRDDLKCPAIQVVMCRSNTDYRRRAGVTIYHHSSQKRIPPTFPSKHLDSEFVSPVKFEI